jgi:hypothetical protein
MPAQLSPVNGAQFNDWLSTQANDDKPLQSERKTAKLPCHPRGTLSSRSDTYTNAQEHHRPALMPWKAPTGCAPPTPRSSPTASFSPTLCLTALMSWTRWSPTDTTIISAPGAAARDGGSQAGGRAHERVASRGDRARACVCAHVCVCTTAQTRATFTTLIAIPCPIVRCMGGVPREWAGCYD